MFQRNLRPRLIRLAQQFPAISVVGPRQSGKTTLVRDVFPDHEYVSLEELDQREFAVEDPRGFLSRFRERAILDEVQHAPGLFSYLQTEIDRMRTPGRWILTGSQNFLLMSGISQSLAGRTAVCVLPPLTMDELLGDTNSPTLGWQDHLFRGLYPEIHHRSLDAAEWYAAYTQTYVQKDVRDVMHIGDLTTFTRFLRLCAGRTGQLLSMNSLAVDTGVSQPTIKSWLSVLETSGLIILLPPHTAGFRKRLVKTPKIYWLDSGLLCHLLRIQAADQLPDHPFRGAVFESFIISELYKTLAVHHAPPDLYFWRDRSGHEVDALIELQRNRYPVEIKSSETIVKGHFKGLAFWLSLDQQTPTEHGTLFYLGDQTFTRSGYRIIPWFNASRWLRALLD